MFATRSVELASNQLLLKVLLHRVTLLHGWLLTARLLEVLLLKESIIVVSARHVSLVTALTVLAVASILVEFSGEVCLLIEAEVLATLLLNLLRC